MSANKNTGNAEKQGISVFLKSL